jgi:intraflagellar transport protein 140
MAKMCVKSHRIDVAKVCLGNMGNVKGIRLLREETDKGADSDTQVALVALNLGMFVSRLVFNIKKKVLLIYKKENIF